MASIKPDPADRRRCVLDLRARHDTELDHSTQVTRLAEVLFDRLVELHHLGRPERELLTYAALLHDIGLAVSENAHHKHAMRLIRSAQMLPFTAQEVTVIALVARYHRKAMPKPTHQPYASLSKPVQRVVRRLASLLRVADGLDRTHRSVVADIQVEVLPARVVLSLWTTGDVQSEIWAATRKSDLFTETFKRDVVFRTVDDS